MDGWALALPWKMCKARFASFTTFWFAQKEPKSLPQDTFHGFTGANNTRPHWGSLQRSPDTPLGELWTLPRHPTGRAYSAPQTPHWGSFERSPDTLAVFKVSASQQRRKGRVDKSGGKGRREERRRMERRGGIQRKEEADFEPSCKNSCGRPWVEQLTNYH